MRRFSDRKIATRFRFGTVRVTLIDAFNIEATVLREGRYVSLNRVVNALAVISLSECRHESFALNLTDEYYFYGKLSLLANSGREQGNPAPPRELGVSFRYNF